jgi:hypothetical protein
VTIELDAAKDRHVVERFRKESRHVCILDCMPLADFNEIEPKLSALCDVMCAECDVIYLLAIDEVQRAIIRAADCEALIAWCLAKLRRAAGRLRNECV